MEKILKYIRKNDIKNIEICFVDIFGKCRGLIVPSKKAKEIIKDGISCDGSSIGCSSVENSDMKIIPDENSYYLLPNGNLLLLASTDYEYDARVRLKKIERDFEKEDIIVNFGTEIEFYLFKKNDKSRKLLDRQGYFSLEDNEYFKVLGKVIQDCEKTNIQIEAVHHECGQNQFEIDFRYSTPTQTADNIIFLKKVLEYRAKQNGLYVCFEPKPIDNMSGSGMHVNMSLFSHEKNLFYDGNDKMKLSKVAYNYIDNILHHICAITAITCPTENSYKRLANGFETPSKADIGYANRNCLIRVPKASEKGTRTELRSPDLSCNPYLAFSAILVSATDNFDSKTINFPKVLPKTLKDALLSLKQDKLISSLVPKTYFDLVK